MAETALSDRRSPAVLSLADRIFQTPVLPPMAVEQWLRVFWVVKPDPPDLEWIKTPEFRALDGDFAGDCDDAATLAASVLLTSAEVRRFWRLWFVAIRMPAEDDFSHVWLRAEDGEFRVDIDPIVPLTDLPVRGYAEELTLQIH